MFKGIINFFDKLEDRVRARLSHHPVVYSIIGGTALILFWEGVSILVSFVPFLHTITGGLILMFVSLSVALMVGIFVSFFVGDTIILSGINKEKKLIDKEESELIAESKMMAQMEKKVDEIDNIIKEMHSEIHPTHDK
jgi:membrane protein DedA with SNARE-associated domain